MQTTERASTSSSRFRAVACLYGLKIYRIYESQLLITLMEPHTQTQALNEPWDYLPLSISSTTTAVKPNNRNMSALLFGWAGWSSRWIPTRLFMYYLYTVKLFTKHLLCAKSKHKKRISLKIKSQVCSIGNSKTKLRSIKSKSLIMLPYRSWK